MCLDVKMKRMEKKKMEKIMLIVPDIPPSCNQQRKKKNFLLIKTKEIIRPITIFFIKFKTPKLQFHTILPHDEMI